MISRQDHDEAQKQDQQEARREARRLDEEGLLEDVIADGVMSALGRPADFLRASARLVAGDSYRVNVFAGPHAGNARVAHSFFVTADGDGRILVCSPPLAREYAAATPV